VLPVLDSATVGPDDVLIVSVDNPTPELIGEIQQAIEHTHRLCGRVVIVDTETVHAFVVRKTTATSVIRSMTAPRLS